jgi:hypothetical protein
MRISKTHTKLITTGLQSNIPPGSPRVDVADHALVERNVLGRVEFEALQWTLGRYRRWSCDLVLLLAENTRPSITRVSYQYRISIIPVSPRYYRKSGHGKLLGTSCEDIIHRRLKWHGVSEGVHLSEILEVVDPVVDHEVDPCSSDHVELLAVIFQLRSAQQLCGNDGGVWVQQLHRHIHQFHWLLFSLTIFVKEVCHESLSRELFCTN